MEKIIIKTKPPAAQQQQLQQSSSKSTGSGPSTLATLRVHLYKTHFTLASQDRPLPYHGPLSSFISALNTCSLGGLSGGGSVATSSLAMAAFNPKYWDRGCVRLECIDHRYTSGSGAINNNNIAASATAPSAPAPSSANKVKLLLQPSPEAIYQDIQAFGLDHFGNEWNAAEMGVELESKVLARFFPTLDLDVVIEDRDAGYGQPHEYDPSHEQDDRPSFAHANQRVPSLHSHALHTLENYNRVKYLHPLKRSFDDTLNKEKDDQDDLKRKQQTKRMVLAEEENDGTEFYPRFSQLDFIETWRRKKKQADEEALIGLGDKTRIKLTSSGIAAPRKVLAFNQNRKIVRTLRFESLVAGTRMFTVFNAYDIGDGQYEGVLRWGTQEGTSVGGNTLRYPLGNKNAVDYYIAHFRGFYGILHKLTADSAQQQ